MTWDVQLSNQAGRALERMPANDRDRIEAALLSMERDPLDGDTKPLKGKHQGAYRRRVGSWRIIFSLKRDIRTVIVADIVRRTSATY